MTSDAQTGSDEGPPGVGPRTMGYRPLALGTPRPPARLTWALAGAAWILGCRPDPAPLPLQSSAAVVAEEAPRCTPPHVRIVGPAVAPADTTLVMLHGYGSDSANIEPVARALAGASPHLVVIVPDGCDPSEGVPGGRQWLARRDPSRGGPPDRDRGARLAVAAGRVSRFVDAELQSRGLPRDRMVWAGFSQGAMLSQWMAVHATPTPLAVVSFSGRFDDDSPVGTPVGTPVLLVHGTRDPVIPFAESRRAEESLVARGAHVEHLDRPDMAHSIDSESLAAAVAFLRRSLGPR